MNKPKAELFKNSPRLHYYIMIAALAKTKGDLMFTVMDNRSHFVSAQDKEE